MDIKLINFKAPREDAERWQASLEKEGRTISDVCRKALERAAQRIERKDGTP